MESSSTRQRHKGTDITEKASNEEVEQCLAGFFRQVQKKDVPVSDEWLMEKSKVIGKELGREFKPTMK